MKKMVALVMTLCIAMSICVSPVQAASFYRYGHSDGHWGIDFATNLNRYGVITTDELNSTKLDDNAIQSTLQTSFTKQTTQQIIQERHLIN